VGNLKKIIRFGLVLFTILFCLLPGNPVLAADSTVKDCYEGKGECKELGPATKKKDQKPAEQPAKQENEPETNTGSFTLDFIKMILALILIVFLIYALLKFLSKRGKTYQNQNMMQNLGGLSVGQNKSVQLVRIGDKLFMLGVGDNVELLEEITDEALKASMFSESGAQGEGPGNLVGNFLRRNSETAGEPAKGFRQLFSNELEKLKENRKRMIKSRREEEDPDE